MTERPPWKWAMDMLREIKDNRTHCFLSSLSKIAFFREPNDAMAAPSDEHELPCDLVITHKGPSSVGVNRGPINNEFGPRLYYCLHRAQNKKLGFLKECVCAWEIGSNKLYSTFSSMDLCIRLLNNIIFISYQLLIMWAKELTIL